MILHRILSELNNCRELLSSGCRSHARSQDEPYQTGGGVVHDTDHDWVEKGSVNGMESFQYAEPSHGASHTLSTLTFYLWCSDHPKRIIPSGRLQSPDVKELARSRFLCNDLSSSTQIRCPCNHPPDVSRKRDGPWWLCVLSTSRWGSVRAFRTVDKTDHPPSSGAWQSPSHDDLPLQAPRDPSEPSWTGLLYTLQTLSPLHTTIRILRLCFLYGWQHLGIRQDV